jgi:hypothetical protein
MSIHLTHGDLLKQNDVDAIVNTVNCVGVMGRGIALQFKNKWPDNFTQYHAACKAGAVRPGKMNVYDAGAYAQPHFIINFPTKDHWRGNSKLSFIQDGLKDLNCPSAGSRHSVYRHSAFGMRQWWSGLGGREAHDRSGVCGFARRGCAYLAPPNDDWPSRHSQVH